MIALTGSVDSGRAVASAAPQSLKRVHLELGGKAPVVIFEDADLAGRRHGSARRRLLELRPGMRRRLPSARPRVGRRRSSSSAWSNEVRSLVVGEPGAGDDVEIGPLVSQAALRAGQRLPGPGRRTPGSGPRWAARPSGPGYFVAPTVLVNVPDGAEVAREEIFGPVVTVETFADEDEAVPAPTPSPYGLSASVWTETPAAATTSPARLDSGTVWVNAHLVLANEAPWGGFKGSGYGRDLSIYALDDYSRTKHVMHNHGR